MTEVPAIVDEEPETVRASEVVQVAPPTETVSAKGADWGNVLMQVMERLLADPSVMGALLSKLGIEAPKEAPPQQLQEPAAVAAQRDRVEGYEKMIQWAPPEMVKGKFLDFLGKARDSIEAMEGKELKLKAEEVLGHATDHDLAVVEAVVRGLLQ